MSAETLQADASRESIASWHPLVERLMHSVGAVRVDAGSRDWIDGPGVRVLFICADIVRFPATLDVAVILPEILAAFPGRLLLGVVDDSIEREIALRFGATKRPSLVFVRDGAWLGTIPAVLDWLDYLREVASILEATPRRPPGVGIAIRVAGDAGGACAETGAGS